MNFKSDSQRRAVFASLGNSFAKKKFYHGSAGLRGRVIVADGLIPPTLQEKDPHAGVDEMRGPEFDDYVFLTTDKDLAAMHAKNRARYWGDTEYGPIVYEAELEESEVVPDTFDPVRYPDSFKYKGIIPREKLKKVKFSEATDELIDEMKGFVSTRWNPIPSILKGDQAADLAAVIAGTKPAAIVAESKDDYRQKELIDLAENMGYTVVKSPVFDPESGDDLGDEYIVGFGDNVKKILELKDAAADAVDKDEYHREFGQALGYNPTAVEDFILAYKTRQPYAENLRRLNLQEGSLGR